MNCETARDRLLEAPLTELRGEGDGALAQHLRGCLECQDRARRILAQTAVLQAALERATPRVEAVQAAWRRRAVPSSARRRWAVVVPLALAASLALLLLGRHPTGQAPESGTPSPTAPIAAPLGVQAPQGRAVTVFQTDNPNIVVIWSF
ncbi:MAG: hypothetical protein HYV20_12065 [Gemmatimonadetes bacterium]|nr:hypothetical protein [Gemmatimonadota bacterium]